MQTPFQLTFRRLPHSEALATHLRKRAEKLEHLFDRIISCHVVVESAGHHHNYGDQYRFTIHLGLPGHELIVNHAPDRGPQDASVTADRAFDEAERQLEDWVRGQRGQRHQETPVGERPQKR